MAWNVPAEDRGQMATHTGGQDWLVSWHPPSEPPAGRPHGAAGVCVTRNGQLVLISHDGLLWGFPAGRPEGTEDIEETLRREVREEACAQVLRAQMLGYARSQCVEGHEEGLVPVRSCWHAEVEVGPWEPAVRDRTPAHRPGNSREGTRPRPRRRASRCGRWGRPGWAPDLRARRRSRTTSPSRSLDVDVTTGTRWPMEVY